MANGTPYAPASLAPQTDDSATVLALKIAALLYNNATGTTAAMRPMVDDDERAALYKACLLLHGAQQGDVTVSF